MLLLETIASGATVDRRGKVLSFRRPFFGLRNLLSLALSKERVKEMEPK